MQDWILTDKSAAGKNVNTWCGRLNFGARFLTTFDFDREYLRNGSTYRTSEKKLHQTQPLPLWAKKFGELWSTHKKVLEVHTEAGDYISAP